MTIKAAEITVINETIAEAMGWTHLGFAAEEPSRLLGHPPNGKPMELRDTPNPYDCISTALEAVEKILGKPYVLYINQTMIDCIAELHPLRWGIETYQGVAETPSAAVALALVESIKAER